MTRPLWTIAEIVAAMGGRLDLPPKKTGCPEGVPPAGCGAGPADRGAVISGISIDSRSLEPGDLFVPLTDARDGHEFVTAAFERGAAAALVRGTYPRKPADGVLIRVPDAAGQDSVLAALEEIGKAARRRLSNEARVIAVTGSAGKTGTKEMLRACLMVCAASPDRVHAPEKSFNNHWGVPLTLARMPADTEYAVFEIGMNHAGEIRPLTKMVRPHIAIVTNVLPVHVGNFEDGEIGVANAKAEIFEGLEAPPAAPLSASPGGASDLQVRRADPGPSHDTEQAYAGEAPGSSRRQQPSLRPGTRKDGQPGATGTAIILRDSPHFELLRAKASAAGAIVISFGSDRASDAWFTAIGGWTAEAAEPIAQIDGHIRTEQGVTTLDYELGMPGVHLATNSLAVLLALNALNALDLLDRAALAPLRDLRPPGGRGARARIGSIGDPLLLIDEAYNANPASMQAALGNLGEVSHEAHSRRVAVLGDMLELGPQSVQYHEDLLPGAMRADRVFCCGPNMRHLYDLLPPEKRGAWAPSSAELIAPVLAELRPGDAVMVKGSLGSRMAPIVEAIKKRFADGSKGG